MMEGSTKGRNVALTDMLGSLPASRLMSVICNTVMCNNVCVTNVCVTMSV